MLLVSILPQLYILRHTYGNTASMYVISKESEEEQHEGSSDTADGHGESSTTAGNYNTAGERGLTRSSHIYSTYMRFFS